MHCHVRLMFIELLHFSPLSSYPLRLFFFFLFLSFFGHQVKGIEIITQLSSRHIVIICPCKACFLFSFPNSYLACSCPQTLLCVFNVYFICMCPSKMHYCFIAHNIQRRSCVTDLIPFLIFKIQHYVFNIFSFCSVYPNLLYFGIAWSVHNILPTTLLQETHAASYSLPQHVLSQ